MVEVTHRAKRQLFGLAELAHSCDGIADWRRPKCCCGGGRRRTLPIEFGEGISPLLLPATPLSPIERSTGTCSTKAAS